MGKASVELIHTKIIAIMAEVGPIAKERQNKQQGYKFRGIDDIYNALHPVLSKHGVYCLPEVQEREVQERTSKSGGALFYTRMTVKFRLVCAEDASSVEGIVTGEAMDSGDKSANKAMSAAMKYFYFQVFCIPTEGDNDADAKTHEPAPKAPPQPQPPQETPQHAALADEAAEALFGDTPPDNEPPFGNPEPEDPFGSNAPPSQPPGSVLPSMPLPKCPTCNGDMWDNTEGREAAQAEMASSPTNTYTIQFGNKKGEQSKYPTAAYTCKDKTCKDGQYTTAIWSQREAFVLSFMQQHKINNDVEPLRKLATFMATIAVSPKNWRADSKGPKLDQIVDFIVKKLL